MKYKDLNDKDKYKDLMITHMMGEGRGGRIQWGLWGGDFVSNLNHQSWMRYQLKTKNFCFL